MVAPHIQMGGCGLRRRDLPYVARLAGACENPEICGTCDQLLQDLREGCCALVRCDFWLCGEASVGTRCTLPRFMDQSEV